MGTLILDGNSCFVAVGNPIAVKQNLSPTLEDINELHQKYLQELQNLFETNKEKYGIPEHKSLIFT